MTYRRILLSVLFISTGLHAVCASAADRTLGDPDLLFTQVLDMFVAAMFLAMLVAYAIVFRQWLNSPSLVLSLLTIRSWHLSGLPPARVWNVLQARTEFISLTERWCQGDAGNKLALNAYMDGIFAGLDVHWRDVLTESEVLITLPMSSRWSLRDLHRAREIGRKTGAAIHRREGVH